MSHTQSATTLSPVTAAPWAARAWAAFAALALGQLLVDVDDVVLNIALPSIAADLHLSAQALPWVVNGYLVCFGGLLLLGGRLADRLGHRAVLLAGVGVFVLASLAGAGATSGAALVLARAGQGVAAALLAPAAMSLLVHTFSEPAARTRALGLWGAVTGAGAVVGLVVGGVVTEHWGWTWIFTGNAVVATAVGVSVLVLLPGGTGDRSIRIEPTGALAATLALVVVIYSLHETIDAGLTAPRSLGLLLLSALCVLVAAAAWRRSTAPLVPRRLLRDRAVLVSDGCAMLTGAALLGTFYFVSLHVQQVQGYSPVAAANAYLPLVAGLVVGAGAGSAVVPRRGARPVLATGLGLAGTGLVLLATLGISAGPVGFWSGLLPGLVVVGTGLGLAFVSLTVSAVPGGEGSTDDGAASGLYNTSLQIGGAVGIALLATVATARSDALLGAGASAGAAVAGGRDLALLVAAGLLLGGVLLALRLPAETGTDNGTHGTGSA